MIIEVARVEWEKGLCRGGLRDVVDELVLWDVCER